MKKLMNDPDLYVREMLEGTVALAPHMQLLNDENVVLRKYNDNSKLDKVCILSGGGTGHEPGHAGFVGEAMLDGAIAGQFFTSPSTDAVLAAIRECSGGKGVLIIVKNYTGDRMHFGLAAEIARAEGIPVEIVVVADDVALRNTVDKGQRRGIAGAILVHKIAGGAAEKGMSLAEVKALAQKAADNVLTMGISLGACTVPAAGKPGFILADDEIEVGLGIHGEQGIYRTKIKTADELCSIIVEQIKAERPLGNNDEVVLLINGLGATPPSELDIVANSILKQIKNTGAALQRAWVGNFLTALDMPGFSISVMFVDKQMLELIDLPTNAPAWKGSGKLNDDMIRVSTHKAQLQNDDDIEYVNLDALNVKKLAIKAAKKAIIAEDYLTELDSNIGDGDLGISMRRGGEALMQLEDASFNSYSKSMALVGDTLRKAIAGSSGAFYAAAFLRASRSLKGITSPTPQDWASSFTAAVNAISEFGGAKEGDKTMIDALQPAAKAFDMAIQQGETLENAWGKAVAAAKIGAEKTKDMHPHKGRASYSGARAIGHLDAGAVAVTVWMEALLD